MTGQRIIIFAIIFLSFNPQKDKAPRLTKLIISEDKDACNAPNAVFEKKYSDDNLNLSFGYDDYFEKQDTISLTFKNDSLLINLVKRNKPRIVFKDGIADTLQGKRVDPDCECFTLFKLEIQDLPKAPRFIIVNRYIHADGLGFVDKRYLQQIRNKVQTLEQSRKFSFDSMFTLPHDLLTYADARELARYLKYRGTLSIEVLDSDTESERKLVARLQKLFIKFEMICPTRISDHLDKKVLDNDSTTISIKISDTKSFLFPEYNWRKR